MKFYESNPAYGSRLMLEDDRGMRVTYGAFDTFFETVEKKLRPDTLLFLFCENTIGSVFFYLTCLRKRIVPLLLDRQMDHEMAERLIEMYDPDYVAMPAEMNLSCRNCSGNSVAAGYEYLVTERKKKANTRLHEDLALLLTTSGNTGSPKLVRHSRENIESNAAAIAEYLELNGAERPISVIPMHDTCGLSIINSHLKVGAAVLLTKHTLFDREFWSFFKQAGATSINGVPQTYEMLKRLPFFQMNLPSLRTMTQAGGKLSEQLHKEFSEHAAKKGRKFVVMHGQVEATGGMGYARCVGDLEKGDERNGMLPETETG